MCSDTSKTAQDEQELRDLDTAVETLGWALLAQGPAGFLYLETLNPTKRAVAVAAMATVSHMPPDIAALVLADPVGFVTVAASDPVISFMLDIITEDAAQHVTPELAEQAIAASERLVAARTAQTQEAGA